jgi:hypothetical protein
MTGFRTLFARGDDKCHAMVLKTDQEEPNAIDLAATPDPLV